MQIYEFLKNVDRKVIYSLMFACVILPLLYPLGLPISASDPVKALYKEIESLHPGDKVAFSFDYDPGSLAEVEPMAIALTYHCWKKGVKIIAPSLWPTGPSMATKVFHSVPETFPDLKDRPYGPIEDGKDYVNLGFYAGPTLGLTQVSVLCTDIRKALPWDVNYTAVDQLPIMEGVSNLEDVKLVVSLSSGDPGIPAWVEIAQARYGIKIAGGATAVQAPQFYPYIQSGQMFGFLGGMRGAAEYEQLLQIDRTLSKASRGMDAQSIAHLLILVLIALANVMFFIERRRQRQRM